MTGPGQGADNRHPVLAGTGVVSSALVLLWLALRHGRDLMHGRISDMAVVSGVAFCYLAFSQAASWWHRDVVGEAPADLRVTVVVTVFREDPAMFAAMLQSISTQRRLPARIHVVDDGSDSDDCRTEFEFWYRNLRPAILEAEYTWQPNAGKRHAQAVAFRADPLADIYITVDSDVSMAHRDTFGNLLAPFTDPRVKSVCGFLMGANRPRNLMYRLIELGFVNSFLNGRSTYSAMGSVTVNTGGLAAYRSEVAQDNLGHYLRQRVMGRQVSSGDDAMMTRYALLRGRTVFQRSARLRGSVARAPIMMASR